MDKLRNRTPLNSDFFPRKANRRSSEILVDRFTLAWECGRHSSSYQDTLCKTEEQPCHFTAPKRQSVRTQVIAVEFGATSLSYKMDD